MNRNKYVIFYLLEAIITGLLFYWLFTTGRVVSNVKVSLEEEHIVGTFLTLGILSYLLGLRHAVDADHLAAIDNSIRKLIQEGKPPQFTGLFFSLGHSTIVILLSLGLIVSTRYIVSQLPFLEKLGSIIGTLVSGSFLYIIGFLNFLVLLEIYRLYKAYLKKREVDKGKLEEVLMQRGFMNKYFSKLFKIVNNQYYLYLIGLLFGLGFDTASETALLAISAAAAGIFLKVPLYTLLVFPFLFTVGMTLIDTTDGLFMNGAYGWAFTDPVRKLWYNLTMTLISIIVSYLVGTIELLGLVTSQFNLSGPFWDQVNFLSNIYWENIGFIIIGTFAITWLTSYLIYKSTLEKFTKK